MQKKITTIESLGKFLQAIDTRLTSVYTNLQTHTRESTESFKSLGDHLVSIEERLEELTELQRLSVHVERIRQHLRERDHVEL
jgi:hypothetical protein